MVEKARRILVTDISGTSGNVIRESFSGHFELHGNSVCTSTDFSNINFHPVDILDSEKFGLLVRKIKPNIIIHIAANTAYRNFPRNSPYQE